MNGNPRLKRLLHLIIMNQRDARPRWCQDYKKHLEDDCFCQVITPQKYHSSSLNCSINCRAA